jgi:hypothetical protein
MSADGTSFRISVIDHREIIDPLAMVAAVEMIESTAGEPPAYLLVPINFYRTYLSVERPSWISKWVGADTLLILPCDPNVLNVWHWSRVGDHHLLVFAVL